MTTNEPLDDSLDAEQIEMSDSSRQRILDTVAADSPPEPAFHLAQMNTARFRYPMDHPDMAGFVEMLDPLNHQADSAPGFLWRLTDEGSNDATSITYYDDPLLLVNMSVWADLKSLRDYVYRTEHAAMVRRRQEWADSLESVHIVMWWVPAGHRPGIGEADAKLSAIRENGPTPEAFNFGNSFPPPSA